MVSMSMDVQRAASLKERGLSRPIDEGTQLGEEQIMLTAMHIKSGEGVAEAVSSYLEHQHDNTKVVAKEVGAGQTQLEEVKTKGAEAVGYYAQGEGSDGKAPSTWFGKGAQALGLSGKVERNDLIRVLNAEGIDLANRRSDRRMGVDFTFSAPKSVSIAALAGNDDRLLEAHREAVVEALEYAQEHFFHIRLGSGGKDGKEYAGNIIAAIFDHEDARPEKGVSDCNLHSHSLVANLMQKANGDWRGIEADFKGGDMIFLLDYVYKTALERKGKDLGYETYQTEDGFEIAGFTREKIEEFSRRKMSIDEQLKKMGTDRSRSSFDERGKANLSSRKAKLQLSQADQRAEWSERARETGLDFKSIRSLGRDRGEVGVDEREAAHREALFSAMRHLGENEDVFTKTSVMLEMLREQIGTSSSMTKDEALAVIEDAQGKGWLIEVEKGSGQFTSKEAVEREGWISGFVQSGNGQAKSMMVGNDAERFIERTQEKLDKEAQKKGERFEFTKGQREALAMALTNENQVAGIVGAAGAGKTTAMAPTVEAAKAFGYQVVGLSTSAKAVQELESAGVDDLRTIASYLTKERKRDEEPTQPRYFVIDEAGMVSSRDMKALMETLRADDRLLLVGDHRQLQSVEAGKIFEYLQSEGMEWVTVGEIMRQKNLDQRKIAQLYSEGKAEEATARATNYMTEIDTSKVRKSWSKTQKKEWKQDEIARVTAKEWLALDAEERAESLIIAGTNRIRGGINHHVRKGLIAEGVIGESLGAVKTREKVNLSREHRGKVRSYLPRKNGKVREGDQLMVVMSGETYEVEGVNEKRGTLSLVTQNEQGGERRIEMHAKHLKDSQVFKRSTLEIAKGELVMFRENDRKLGVVNGDTGRVIGRNEKTGNIQVEMPGRERPLEVDGDQARVLEHAYARTVHTSQGMTVNRAFFAVEGGMQALANMAYVALTRHKFDVQVITDKVSAITKQFSKWSERESATERLNPAMIKKEDGSGRIVDFGSAPYEHDPNNKANYFITLEKSNGAHATIWGVGLRDAIDRAAVERGDHIHLAHDGSETVKVSKQVKAKDGHWKTEEIEVQRNRWEITEAKDRMKSRPLNARLQSAMDKGIEKGRSWFNSLAGREKGRGRGGPAMAPEQDHGMSL